MKTHTLHIVVALGLLICGGRTGIAQQLSLSAPIIIRVTDIDRYGVSVMPCAKVMDGTMLGLPFQGMKQAAVDALVRKGVYLHRSVWIMDEQKVIAECGLVGEFINKPVDKAKTEYGLTLGFDSVEEAKKVGNVLRLEPSGPSLDELLRRGKSQLNDQRFWNDF
jgi:hypothetical protein